MPTLEQVQREIAGRSLAQFIRRGWQHIDPSAYMHGWHIDAICEHLQAVNTGDIRRLLINVPPRHMKSIAVSVAWPAWTWAQQESEGWIGAGVRFLYASYAQALSVRDSVKCRRLIESPWYRQHWGDRFSLTGDQNTKLRFENNAGGYRLATSVDGSLTGEGGDIIVIDDPHNVVEADSDLVRENALSWWDQAMSTRLNDPKRGAYVMIMQRVHEADLSGHVLKELGWTHLCLPAEYEAGHPNVWARDPRKEEGALLWPERIGSPELEELKHKLGPYGSAGQLQQRPSPADGVYFRREWFRFYDRAPDRTILQVYGASDYAVTEDGGDYTVHGVFGIDPAHNIWVLDWWRDQTGPDVWIETLIDLAQKWKPLAWAEEAGQIRKSVGPFLQKRMAERNAYFYREQFTSASDKATRGRAIQARAAMGKVYLPKNASWMEPLLNELLRFPRAIHDDQVDVLSLLGRMLDKLVPGHRPEPTPPREISPPRITFDMLWEDHDRRKRREAMI